MATPVAPGAERWITLSLAGSGVTALLVGAVAVGLVVTSAPPWQVAIVAVGGFVLACLFQAWVFRHALQEDEPGAIAEIAENVEAAHEHLEAVRASGARDDDAVCRVVAELERNLDAVHPVPGLLGHLVPSARGREALARLEQRTERELAEARLVAG